MRQTGSLTDNNWGRDNYTTWKCNEWGRSIWYAGVLEHSRTNCRVEAVNVHKSTGKHTTVQSKVYAAE